MAITSTAAVGSATQPQRNLQVTLNSTATSSWANVPETNSDCF
jgi:hypothetical protein